MDNSFKIKLVNANEYLVRADAEGQTVESLVRLNPDFLEEIGLGNRDEQKIIEETLQFMAEHQSVIDFPPMVDLEDVAAAYSDYASELRRRLTPPTG